MCGLMAILGRTRSPSPDAVRLGLEALRHRGPDATGLWSSPDGRIILGHDRLSLVDLAAGDQPLRNETGTILAIVNGEFYGYAQMRADLEARGHRFRSRSDSEILLHLYEEHGTACLAHLRGEFAFVLWDEARQMLFAARDRFGIKPLFYAVQDGQLFLASEVKALHAAGVEAAWDEASALQQMTIASLSAGQSLFRGVKTLPPGHHMIGRDGGLALEKYWDFDFAAESDLPVGSDRDYAERFRGAMEEAVRLRLQADVPVGCYLSGGLDSCSVLGLMAKLSSTPVRAFTLSFDHPVYDEASIAREMADHAGAELTVIPVAEQDLAENFSDAIWHAERPMANAHGVAKFMLSAAVRQAGYKAVLTGEGADEILAGYAHFRLDLLRSAAAGGLGTSAQALADSNPASRGLLLPDGSVPVVPVLIDRLGYVPAFTEAFTGNFMKLAPFLPAGTSLDGIYATLLDGAGPDSQIAGRHPVNRSLYLWNKTLLPNYILTMLGDRMEMAHSIEGRVPFLDHHVVELTRSFPVDQKIKGTIEKYVLREAMRPLLTKTVYQRQKHPFLAPPSLFRPGSPLNGLLQDTLRGGGLSTLPFLDGAAMIALLDRLPGMTEAERAAWELPLTLVLGSCVLAQRFGL